MATDQASRMLKLYKKKLVHTKEMVDLDDLESELLDLLNSIRERKDKTNTQKPSEPGKRREMAKAATEHDVDQLATLLEGSTIETPPITARADVKLAPT